MSNDWVAYYKKAEEEAAKKKMHDEQEAIQREKQAEQQKQQDEQLRKQNDQLRKQSTMKIITKFDSQISSILKGYASVKMRGIASVYSPDSENTSYLEWRLKCDGYVDITINMSLKSISSTEIIPEKVRINGIHGGQTTTQPDINDIASALVNLSPMLYTPPPSCGCDSYGGMSYNSCP
ncbi:MAG: hypothetical protein AB9907_07295 [Flexilinea sp.]